jgi:beta-glucanase (GH16 family)
LLESDSFDATAVSGYGIGVAEPEAAGTLYIDDVTLFTMENTSAALWSDEQPQYRFVIDESINWESRDWTLIWSDEFDEDANTSINPENWTCEIGGHGWGNNELEYYTDALGNVSHGGDGNLVITAQEGQPESEDTCWYGQCAYTSARCTTQDKVEFTYGRVEARMKIAKGQGIWPAFWMLGADFPEIGWPASGEIDIMEVIGREPNTLYGTIHGPGYSGANNIGGHIVKDEDFADDYHVFAVDWDPNIIRWYVDGELYNIISVNDTGSREWAFDHDFFIITNIAIGGSWPGSPDESTEFPQELLIDYVRVYQLSENVE